MKKLVMVECISQFRIRYVVEVEDNIDDALDDVIMKGENFKEFSQEYMGELPISHREISLDEYYKLFDQDNNYMSNWTQEEKLQLVNKVNGDKNDNTNSGNET